MKTLLYIALILVFSAVIADANAFVIRGGGAIKATGGGAIIANDVDVYVKENSTVLLKDSSKVYQKLGDIINNSNFVITDSAYVKTHNSVYNCGDLTNKNLIVIGK